MGEPRFPARTDAANLWFGRSCNSDQYDRSERGSMAYFLFGMLAATVLEYITGAVMERLFMSDTGTTADRN